MVPVSASRLIAMLLTFFCFSAAPAAALERPINPVADYSHVLRVINPKLPEWQSRRYATSVLANAMRTHVDPRFIMAIVTVESAWKSNARSRVGARGLGQLMPSTAKRLQVNAWDPAENLRGTANYLKYLLDGFRGQRNAFTKAIAGYNAGPNAIKRFGGIPPYGETQHYVTKVLRVYDELNARIGVAWTPYARHRVLARRVVASSVADGRQTAAGTADEFALADIPVYTSSF